MSPSRITFQQKEHPSFRSKTQKLTWWCHRNSCVCELSMTMSCIFASEMSKAGRWKILPFSRDVAHGRNCTGRDELENMAVILKVTCLPHVLRILKLFSTSFSKDPYIIPSFCSSLSFGTLMHQCKLVTPKKAVLNWGLPFSVVSSLYSFSSISCLLASCENHQHDSSCQGKGEIEAFSYWRWLRLLHLAEM